MLISHFGLTYIYDIIGCYHHNIVRVVILRSSFVTFSNSTVKSVCGSANNLASNLACDSVSDLASD